MGSLFVPNTCSMTGLYLSRWKDNLRFMDLVEKRTEQETVVVIHNCIALPAEKEQIYLRALSQK